VKELKFTSELKTIENVHQIKIDIPWDVKFVCVYLYKIKENYILFDAGLAFGNWPKLFFSSLKKLDISPNKITHCFISHSHLDHIGLIGKLKRKNPHIKILMHDITHQQLKWENDPENSEKLEKDTEKTIQKMSQYGITKKQGKILAQYFLKWPRMKRYHKPDVILHDDDEIEIQNTTLRVIWTPGHSLGHICLFDTNKKYLFSGDHILSRITPHIGLFIVNKSIKEQYQEYDFNNILELYLKSLKKIYKLKPKIIFPAHQEIIRDPMKRISDIQAHHKQRLHEIKSVIKNNPMSPYEISKIHFGDLDEINSFLALSEVLAHLRFLKAKGEVKIEKSNKVIQFYS
jgi:glyoxylase-like metal-dependent hydrolase (beta-lactamase superfamily II)